MSTRATSIRRQAGWGIAASVWLLLSFAGPGWAEPAAGPGQAAKAPTTRPAQASDVPTTQRAGLPLPDETEKRRLTLKEGRDTGDLLPQTLALVAVILVLGGISWFVLKRGLPKLKSTAPGRSVQVLETTYVNPRQAVHLLQVGRRKLLIAGSRDQLSMLADVTEGGSESQAGKFDDLLAEEDSQLAGDQS